LSFAARAKRGEIIGLAISAEKSLIKVLLFIGYIPSRIDIGNRNSLNLGFESAAIVHLFFLFSSGRFGWSSLKALRP